MRRTVFTLALLFAGNLSWAQQLWVISTYAGGGPNGVALNSSIGLINGLATDATGNLFISTVLPSSILEVSGGKLSRVAGAGTASGIYLGDGVPATLAVLPTEETAGIDTTGQIFIPDGATNHIYKVDISGIITTIAGNGAQCGFDGDGPALQHSLCRPLQVVPDAKGNIFVSDSGNCIVRKIDSQGNMTTIAGVGPSVYGTCLAYDGDGPATSHTVSPTAIAIDASGNLYISDGVNNRVRKVDTTGNMTTVAGNGMAAFSGDGGPATSASLYGPNGLAVDVAGNLYIMDTNNLRVRKVDTGGTISTVAGNGGSCTWNEAGPALQEGVCAEWVAIDPAGNLYVDQSQLNVVDKIDTSGNLTLFAGNSLSYDTGIKGIASQEALLRPNFVTTDPSGIVYFTELGDFAFPDGIIKVAGDGTTSLIPSSGLSAVDGNGNFFWANANGNQVIEFTAGGNGTVVAGSGHLAAGGLCFFDGDGPATAHALCAPSGVAVDSSGNFFIADTDTCRVRKVDTSGNMTTIAGGSNCTYDGDGPATSHSLNLPTAVAVDSAGNVYVADTGNNRVREISADGTLTTIGGNGMLLNGQCIFDGDGPGNQHGLCSPNSVAADSFGNVFVVDPGNQRVRMISGGNMTTLAGNGQLSFAGENAPASTAVLNHPMAIATDASGNVYVADEYNNRIRKISQTSTFVVSAGQPQLIVTAGKSGTVTLHVTPANGFSGTVSFSCSGAPQGATCTPSPASESVSGSAASTTFTVTTTASAAVLPQWQAPGMVWFALVFACMACVASFKRRRLAVGFATVLLMVLAGCGGSGGSSGGGGGGGGGGVTSTPPGSYTLTLSAVSGNTAQSTTVVLKVQ